jgi:dCTP deaminase
MILSDYDIDNAIRAKRLVVKPLRNDAIRENSLDLRLGSEIAVRNKKFTQSFVFDPTNAEHIKDEFTVEEGLNKLVIPAGEQVLLSSEESIRISDDLMGFIALRSTFARHGLMIAPTIIEAGFEGNITLAVTNSAGCAIELKPGMKFAHVVLAQLMNKTMNPYKGSYLNQKGVWLPKVLK